MPTGAEQHAEVEGPPRQRDGTAEDAVGPGLMVWPGRFEPVVARATLIWVPDIRDRRGYRRPLGRF